MSIVASTSDSWMLNQSQERGGARSSSARFLRDRIATHILSFEGDAHVEWFEGNFADYIEDWKRRLGVEELIPRRVPWGRLASG